MDDSKRRQIKTCFRQSMNADLSNSMRSHGLNYKIIFGVPAPRIRLIAQQFEPNATDAEELWQENVRESKILATYLFPVSQMTPELAQQWVEQIPYTEIADQVCMNLFSQLSFAKQLAFEWVDRTDSMVQYTGIRLLSRLLMNGHHLSEEEIHLLSKHLRLLLQSKVAYVQTGAIHLSEKMIESDKQSAHILYQTLQDWRTDEELVNKQLFDFLFGEESL